MKCSECGYNSFDYLELCKKCGAPLYPDPLFQYVNRNAEHKPDTSPGVRSEGSRDETADGEMPHIPVPGTDDESFVGEQGELIQNQRVRSSNIEKKIGRESFKREDVSKETTGGVNAELGSVGTGEEIPLFEGDDELPDTEEFPLVFDENDEGLDGPDLAREIEFDGRKPELFNLAGIGVRVAAFILDIFLVSATAFLSIAAGLYLLNGSKVETPGLERVVLPLYLALFFLASTYFVFLHGFGGKTVGKMIFGIRLINSEGEAVGVWESFVRWIGYFVSAGFLFVGFLWSLFDAEGQTWHDKIAGTYVVKD